MLFVEVDDLKEREVDMSAKARYCFLIKMCQKWEMTQPKFESVFEE